MPMPDRDAEIVGVEDCAGRVEVHEVATGIGAEAVVSWLKGASACSVRRALTV